MVRRYYMHFLLGVASLALLALPLGAKAAGSDVYGKSIQENQVTYGTSSSGADNWLGDVNNLLEDGIYGQKSFSHQGKDLKDDGIGYPPVNESRNKPVEQVVQKEGVKPEVKNDQCQGQEVKVESAQCAPQVIRPVIIKPVIKPIEVVNVVRPEIIKPVIKPVVIKKIVRPVIIKPVVRPVIIKPIIVEKVIQPVMVKTVVKPVETKKVIKPVIIQTEVKPIIKEVCYPAVSQSKYETKSGYDPTKW